MLAAPSGGSSGSAILNLVGNLALPVKQADLANGVRLWPFTLPMLMKLRRRPASGNLLPAGVFDSLSAPSR